MTNTKIEWCDSTWNPVTGCLNGCEYCYARGIARRFDTFDKNPNIVVSERHKWKRLENTTAMFEVSEPIHWLCKGKETVTPYPFGFTPTLHRYRLGKPQKWKTPRTIFVGSMCDLFGEWAPDEWIYEVFKACAAAPQHRYLFLTKNPKRYGELVDKGVLEHDGSEEPNPHFRFGATATDSAMFAEAAASKVVDFLSCEPMLNPIEISNWGGVKWLIVGAEAGNRKGKIKPEREWVEEICKAADQAGIPVFMKNSLLPIMGEENMRRELPWKEATK